MNKPIRVLFPILPRDINPYAREIADELLKLGVEVETTPELLWLPERGSFDIIHIQWPEILTSVLLNRDYIVNHDNINAELFVAGELISRWKTRSRLVVTRHNGIPHLTAYRTPFNRLLYETIYSNADGVVHLGRFSLDEYAADNAATALAPDDQLNRVIPHQAYASYPNTIDREAARKELGIPASSRVVLVFGSVRTPEEAEFVRSVFDTADIPGKLLLAPRWYTPGHQDSGPVMRIIRKQLDKLSLRFARRARFGTYLRSVQADEAQLYFNAADVVFNQRFSALNTGVVPMAFAFGKAVVAPDTGNTAGQVSAIPGNLLYTPGDVASAAARLTEIFKSDTAAIGESNRIHAEKEISAADTGRRHLEFYRELLGRTGQE